MSASTFQHRQPNSHISIIGDSVPQALDRAKAIIDLIEVACEVVDVNSFEPSTLWRAAQAARFEILDAQLLLEAYRLGEQSGKKG
jgi:hypothetical protein